MSLRVDPASCVLLSNAEYSSRVSEPARAACADSHLPIHQRTLEVLRQRIVESLAHDEGKSSCFV